jgi:PAS domain S-box-containing protein
MAGSNIPRPYRRLPALIIAITLIALTIGWIALHYVERTLINMAGESLAVSAADIADKMDLILFEPHRDIQVITKAPIFHGQDTEAMTRYLNHIKQLSPIYHWLAIVDPAGRIIAATDSGSIGKNLAGENWFKAVRAQDGVVLQDPEVFGESGTWTVGFTAPIKGPAGEFRGAVHTRIGLPVLEGIFTRTVGLHQAQRDTPARFEWQFLTRDGLVIADSILRQEGRINLKQLGLASAHLTNSDKPGFIEESHLRRNTPVITGYAKTKGFDSFPGFQWGVLVRMDRSDALAPIHAVLWKLAAAGGFIAGPLIGLLLWTAGRLRTEYARVVAAESTLRESYQFLHSTLDSLSAHIAILDQSGMIVAVNEAWRQAPESDNPVRAGYGVGFNYMALCDTAAAGGSQEAAACAAGLRSVMAGEKDLFSLDYSCHSQQERYWFTLRATRFQGDGPARLVVAHENITARKLAQEQLTAERTRLAVTLRSIGDGVITTDQQGRVVLMNIVAETLTGWTQQEAAGLPLTRVFHIINEKTREPCENPVEKVLVTGGIVGLANHTALIAKDGIERTIADSGSPIRDEHDGTIFGVVLVFRDITERVKLEQELLTARKLESIGVLAGGIAHDFNNILTAILGNLSLAKMMANPKDEIFELLTEGEKASLRARGLTQQLLTFAKGGAPVKKLTSVKELLRETTIFALHGSTVLATFSLSDDLWAVDADEGQLSQVIHNLVLNAQQAMPTGGVVTVRGENIRIGPPAPEQPFTLTEGPYVRISVTDQGTGISEQHLSRIFDPYFTTKQTGSGLGLATAYSIIKSHGGHISVDAKLGRGSTFNVYLPASLTTALPREEVAAPNLNLPSKGKILVMDDEDSVRQLLGKVLVRLGYEAEFAPHGADAIMLYRRAQETGHPFDAVILDLTIPGGMGGLETLQRLRELNPQVKAIVSSGYANGSVMAEFRAHGFQGMIAKPYQIPDVNDVLYRVIHGIA